MFCCMKLSWNVMGEKNILKILKKYVIFSRISRTSSFSFPARWLWLQTVFINRLFESVCTLVAQQLIVHIQYLVVVVTLFNSYILLVSIVSHPYQYWLKFYTSKIIRKNNELNVIRIAVYCRHDYFFIFHFRHFSTLICTFRHFSFRHFSFRHFSFRYFSFRHFSFRCFFFTISVFDIFPAHRINQWAWNSD